MKLLKYQNVITAHAQSIHVRIEFTRRNTFRVLYIKAGPTKFTISNFIFTVSNFIFTDKRSAKC